MSKDSMQRAVDEAQRLWDHNAAQSRLEYPSDRTKELISQLAKHSAGLQLYIDTNIKNTQVFSLYVTTLHGLALELHREVLGIGDSDGDT